MSMLAKSLSVKSVRVFFLACYLMYCIYIILQLVELSLLTHIHTTVRESFPLSLLPYVYICIMYILQLVELSLLTHIHTTVRESFPLSLLPYVYILHCSYSRTVLVDPHPYNYPRRLVS